MKPGASAITRIFVSVVAAAATVSVVGCTQGPVLRGRISGLNDIVKEAGINGAKRCAPREFALAQAHLQFATTDLDQGELSQAEAHLAIAEPNARAARSSSPADRCTDHAKPGDRDGDGIVDDKDKCPDQPETYNLVEDTDGCPDDPDTDNDGITDSHDQCLLEPEDKDGYLDDDGCPDLDNDADGIPDDKDAKCPNQPEDLDGFQDEDGCPDPDNDGDTVLDVDDFCPNTAGSPGGERPGCPKKNSLVVVTATEIRITQQIQFDFNKASIKAVSFPILNEVRDVLRDNPKIRLEIQGHTDNVGNGGYNLKLSQQRADSVTAYLVKNGIPTDRLVSKGYGATQPLLKNDTDANRALNRRVQFIRTEKP